LAQAVRLKSLASSAVAIQETASSAVVSQALRLKFQVCGVQDDASSILISGAMNERYFEDLEPGARFQSDSLQVNEKQLIEFAHKFDPQMFHLDRKTAERSIFKGLVASGWHTAAMTMRLFVQTLNFAQGAVGLGVDELRWPQAVRPGDILRVETEIVEARLSRSKPRHGIIRLRNVTTNQRGEVVQSMYANALVPRRAGGNVKSSP
jgi:acyl dehydratase